ncbi:hypothetical protein [Nocardia neocaledoniensis]|uniref:hypothetical protein n=1 Tax=Nocardia neocaledoniensis TaxID=236511 RepID=UPI0035A23FA5
MPTETVAAFDTPAGDTDSDTSVSAPAAQLGDVVCLVRVQLRGSAPAGIAVLMNTTAPRQAD